jgi:hypothetical protein
MLIIVDHRIPARAKEKLRAFGEIMELKTEGIVYPAISGHPDIFFCQGPVRLMVAPNLPEEYLHKLNRDSIPFVTGKFPVGNEYPETARYNAVVTDHFLIHNFRHTDLILTRTFEDQIPVHVDQGYCRCNLLALKDDHFITSDEGIYKVLKQHTKNVLKVTVNGILLEGFPNGFFGGCCGVLEDKVFITGSLKHYSDGQKVEAFLKDLRYEIIELYDGPLFDGGGILFVSVKF